MSISLANDAVIKKWENAFADGSDKRYPSLDLVRLEKWFLKGGRGRLLEYGFGSGVNLIHLLECGYEIDAVDVAKGARTLVEKKLADRPDIQERARLHLVSSSDHRLPFEDGVFDYLTCLNVLSLIGSAEAVESLLREFVRVLKPGARAILDVNAPDADFARDMEPLGNHTYAFRNNADDEPVPTWCPPSDVFEEVVARYFKIDNVGYTSHSYLKSRITEHIICAHKA